MRNRACDYFFLGNKPSKPNGQHLVCSVGYAPGPRTGHQPSDTCVYAALWWATQLVPAEMLSPSPQVFIKGSVIKSVIFLIDCSTTVVHCFLEKKNHRRASKSKIIVLTISLEHLVLVFSASYRMFPTDRDQALLFVFSHNSLDDGWSENDTCREQLSCKQQAVMSQGHND